MTFEDTVLRQAFHHFDKSDDDKISRDELREALDKLGLPTNSLQLKLMVKAVDRDHDGTISFEEFKSIANLLRSGKGEQQGEH